MGSGASSASSPESALAAKVTEQEDMIAKLKEALKAKEQEVAKLKADMEDGPPSPLPVGVGSVRASIFEKSRRGTVTPASPASRKASIAVGSVPEKKPARRGEVSAEVFNKANADKEEPYEQVIVEKSDEAAQLIRNAIDNPNCLLFSGLRDAEKDECVKAFFKVQCEDGKEIIKQGDVGDNFYVVESGCLEVFVKMSSAAPAANYGRIQAGQSFGELALMYNQPRAATIKATEACVLWGISRNCFRKIHMHFKSLRKKRIEGYLRKVPQFEKLSKHEFSRLADAVEEETFEAGHVIIRQGEVGDHFYVIVDGEVKFVKDDEEQGKGGEGVFFGELALLKDDVRAATVEAVSTVSCLTMGRRDFKNLLGPLNEISKRADSGGEEGGSGQDANKHAKNIKFEDLQMKFQKGSRSQQIVLGQGAFGRVIIVKHKTTGETYALKCLNKTQIVENQLEQHVVDERRVMAVFDHQFLLKLYNSYWDDKYIYLLLELCLGGELFTFLRKAGRFPEKASRFYASGVIKAFECMHSHNIIYRDLKPENLMLDNQGYLKVVDFGLAKTVTDRTWTLCGTPDYLAPEIILTKGHNKAVDYWALGVLIYEMTAGFVPFYADDPMEVYQLILDGDLKFPSHFSRSACDLIRKLMNSNVSKRMGNTKGGVNDIIRHRWFAGYDWDGLLARKLTPPIRVKVKDAEDTSNFDDYGDEAMERVRPCKWNPDFPYEVKNGVTVGI